MPCRKVIYIELVRTISGQQFVDGIAETLLPRLKGQCGPELDQLKATLSKGVMEKGAVFLMSFDGAP